MWWRAFAISWNGVPEDSVRPPSTRIVPRDGSFVFRTKRCLPAGCDRNLGQAKQQTQHLGAWERNLYWTRCADTIRRSEPNRLAFPVWSVLKTRRF